MANKPRDLPILFQGDMVRAVLDDRKHLTSRVIKPQPFFCRGEYWTWHSGRKAVPGYKGQEFSDFCQELAAHARYQVGDRLWVRETWGLAEDADSVLAQEGVTPGELAPSTYADLPIFYRANGGGNEAVSRWRPSIHMPRWASRINLEVTAVSAQRIQQIGEEEAIAEGVAPLFTQDDIYKPRYHAALDLNPMPYRNYLWHGYVGQTITRKQSDNFEYQYSSYPTAVGSFASLWDSINSTPKLVKAWHGLEHYASYPWDYQDNVAKISKHRGKTHLIYGNPFVFVYRFKRVEDSSGN